MFVFIEPVKKDEDQKGFFSKVGTLFKGLKPGDKAGGGGGLDTAPIKSKTTSGSGTDDDYSSSGSGSDGEFSDYDDEDGEDEDGGVVDEAESEIEAEKRVKALLFNHLATKRTEFGIKYDIAPASTTSELSITPATLNADDNDEGEGENNRRGSGGGGGGSGGEVKVSADAEIKSFLQQEQPQCKVVVFQEDQMGMAMTKGNVGEAIVTEVTRGSPAWRAGVVVGDVILGINALRTSDFNEILWVMRHAERPMHLLLYSPPPSRN
jgi:hypothetical protein